LSTLLETSTFWIIRVISSMSLDVMKLVRASVHKHLMFINSYCDILVCWVLKITKFDKANRLCCLSCSLYADWVCMLEWTQPVASLHIHTCSDMKTLAVFGSYRSSFQIFWFYHIY
jgi:hypothetical protein